VRYTIKRGDTAPAIAGVLLDARKRPVPIADDDVVRFYMRNRDLSQGGEIAGKLATVTDAEDGEVEYRWEDGDTDVDGVYDGEFVIEFFGGGKETFPNGEYINIVILPDVASNLATPP
jgi:hypothetical protein